jgi:hypothetical protein
MSTVNLKMLPRMRKIQKHVDKVRTVVPDVFLTFLLRGGMLAERDICLIPVVLMHK